MLKDTGFYNYESGVYSAARYTVKSQSYIHFLYNDRYEIINNLLISDFKDVDVKNILEIGCADGIITNLLSQKFPNAKIVSTDLSEEMIVEGKKRNIKNAYFYVRGNEPELKYDLVVYLGVFNLMDIDYEIGYIKEHLLDDGKVIMSFAAKESFYNIVRPFGHLFKHLLSLRKYNHIFKNNFIVEKKTAHGFFIPYLWKFSFAQKIQCFFENILKKISYAPFHEQIYILSKKNNYLHNDCR